MSSSLTVLIILVTVLHVAVFAIMIAIRVRRSEADGPTSQNVRVTPCAVCGAPANRLDYDGLDPDEQRDPHTGRRWSADTAHYQPLCAAH